MAYRVTEDGSYVRTVRCGYCYETGHNKSSCPKRKKDLAALIADREAELAADNFEHEHYRTYAQRNLEHARNELKKMQSRGKNRKCSFCGEQGHTRRTCTARKNHISDLTGKTRAFREQLLDRMNEFGLGVGTLVNVPRRRDEENQLVYEPGLVTDINWEKLDHRNEFDGTEYYMRTSRFIGVTMVTPEKDRWGDDISFRRLTAPIELMMSSETLDGIDEEVLSRSKSNYPTMMVLSPVDSVDFPDDFLSETEIESYIKKEIVDAK